MDNINKTGHEYHIMAEEAREEGKFIEALELTDKALVAYGKENNLHGFTEIMASRSNTFRHLARVENNSHYLTLATYELRAALEIAESAGQKEDLAMLFIGLGRTLDLQQKLPEAVEAFSKAVQYMTSNPPKEHDRPGVLADFKVTLAAAEYRAGDKSAQERLDQAIAELENSGEDKISDYNYKVWLSGAHMKGAEMLKDDDLELAKSHLAKAKDIIDSDPEKLALRLQQFQELAKKFN